MNYLLLRNFLSHKNDQAAVAKIDASNSRIKSQKHFFEFLCLFRPENCTIPLVHQHSLVWLPSQIYSSPIILSLFKAFKFLYFDDVMGSMKRCHSQKKYKTQRYQGAATFAQAPFAQAPFAKGEHCTRRPLPKETFAQV